LSDVKSTILKVLREIQVRNSYPLRDINDNTMVVKNLGFSSLDVAELVAVLEMELGVDPFSQGVSIMNVHTVGELCKVYTEFLEKSVA
jgi:acyl carrier protein